MYLMFNNCMTYNPPNTFVYQQGASLLGFFRRALKQAKKQFMGDAPPSMSSSARISAGPEIHGALRQRIDSVDIPVVFETVPRPPAVDCAFPETGAAAFYHLEHPANEFDGEELRFTAGCQLIRRSAKVRAELNRLRERFPQFIVEDAVRRLSGLHASFPIDFDEVESALASEIDEPGAVAIGEAPCGKAELSALARSCPQLPLGSATLLNDDEDVQAQRNLRLMLFYNNSLKYWKGADLAAGKNAVMEAITKNITALAMRLPPKKIIGQREVPVLQHIAKSTQ
jgi:hypothetical protein